MWDRQGEIVAIFVLFCTNWQKKKKKVYFPEPRRNEQNLFGILDVDIIRQLKPKLFYFSSLTA